MTWLLLSILCSTAIFVVFKLLPRFQIGNLQAIIVNYITAGSLGLLQYSLSGDGSFGANWWIFAAILSLAFILLFQLMASAAQRIGVARVSVAVKMSLVLPVIAGVILYSETLSPWQIGGIGMALTAVYLSSAKSKKTTNRSPQSTTALVLIAVLFFGSGLLDVYLKYLQAVLVPPAQQAYFIGASFAFAALWGFAINTLRNKHPLHLLRSREILGGIVLGIPNYGSIYFLIKALEGSSLGSAAIFPINNVGIVLCSALVGALIFRESLSARNIWGIALAILSILLIAGWF